jgi:gamma-glutamyltranspeptidase/glutathione hydrolase
MKMLALAPCTLTGLLGLLLLLAFGVVDAHADDRPQPEAASGFVPRPVAVGQRSMAVTANPHATEAAVAMLARGGSAVDAAIAAQLALNVVEPQSSGIGGGGFLLFYDRASGRVLAYDGRETAPASARPDRFLDAAGRPLDFQEALASGQAVGAPGLLAMLAQAHTAHGRLPWAELFAPAIRLAEEGFAVSPRLHQLIARDALLPHSPKARLLFYDMAGRPLPVGARLRNPELADVLRQIAAGGAAVFYGGGLAQDIVAAVRTAPHQPGDLGTEDLAAYRPRLREPVCAPYRGFRVCSAPPPAGGVTLLQILGMLERFEARDPEDILAVHRFAEAGRLAYADRAHYLADPDFVTVPVTQLLDPGYLAARARLIRDEDTLGHAEPGALPEAAGAGGDGGDRSATTHLSVVDAEGNAVALSSSIEDAFGSRLMVRGFLLNNQLTDFAFRPEAAGQAVANRVEGGKRPRSAMAPTLVFDREGRLHAVLGSPGGSRIINYVARAIVAIIDGGLEPDRVVRLPHAGSRNGPTELERDRSPPALAEALRRLGHEIVQAEMTSGLHLIVRAGDTWIGVADPRREGCAAGESGSGRLDPDALGTCNIPDEGMWAPLPAGCHRSTVPGTWSVCRERTPARMVTRVPY